MMVKISQYVADKLTIWEQSNQILLLIFCAPVQDSDWLTETAYEKICGRFPVSTRLIVLQKK